MSHPELWPIFRIAATAWSGAPEMTAETAQQRCSPRWPAAAARRKQSLSGGGQSARSSGDRTRQCRVSFPFCERVEECKRADQEIVPRRRQPGTQSDQTRNGLRRCRDCDAISLERVAQPGLRSRAMRGRAMRASGVSPVPDSCRQYTRPRPSGGSLGCDQTCNGATDIIQLAVRPGARPARRAPQLTAVEGEPSRVADRDASVRNGSRLTWIQPEIRSNGARHQDPQSASAGHCRWPARRDRRTCPRSGDKCCARTRLRPLHAGRVGRILAPECPIAGSGR